MIEEMGKDEVVKKMTEKQIEDMGPQLELVAKMVKVYYQGAVKQGLPSSVVNEMAIDFHRNMLPRFFPPANPLTDFAKAMENLRKDK